MNKQKDTMLVIGKALLFAGIQFSLGGIEMSSKFSVKLTKDQETLDNAVVALREYVFVGFIWMIGNCLVFYSCYGWRGLVAAAVANLAFMLWIYLSYYASFRTAARKNNLVVK